TTAVKRLSPRAASLPEALTKLVCVKDFSLTLEEAVAFLNKASTRTSASPSTRSEPSVPATPGTGEPRDNRNARRELNPDNPEDLVFVKVLEGYFGETRVFNWNELADCAIRTAVERDIPFDSLKRIARVQERNPHARRFHQVQGTNLWVGGMDAHNCWLVSLKLAKEMNANIRVIFEWQVKEGAAYPGEQGLLHWSPSK
ncbi:MAG: hypothetical protein Q7R41_19420, partial [Phycisphaerales bacterium]|nr:hypothetical protein [Phycisphaerales bacterium]